MEVPAGWHEHVRSAPRSVHLDAVAEPTNESRVVTNHDGSSGGNAGHHVNASIAGKDAG